MAGLRLGFKRRKPRDRTPVAISAVMITLTALKESADAFPPLKGAVAGVLHVVDLSQKVKSNKDECQKLASRVQEILDRIALAVPDATRISPDLLTRIDEFTRCVSTRCTLSCKGHRTTAAPQGARGINRRVQPAIGWCVKVVHTDFYVEDRNVGLTTWETAVWRAQGFSNIDSPESTNAFDASSFIWLAPDNPISILINIYFSILLSDTDRLHFFNCWSLSFLDHCLFSITVFSPITNRQISCIRGWDTPDGGRSNYPTTHPYIWYILHSLSKNTFSSLVPNYHDIPIWEPCHESLE